MGPELELLPTSSESVEGCSLVPYSERRELVRWFAGSDEVGEHLAARAQANNEEKGQHVRRWSAWMIASEAERLPAQTLRDPASLSPCRADGRTKRE